MKKELTLVILAAGMGSRFGGLKQVEPIGPNGEFIIDYSIYDAIRAGFSKVVFIIKKENYDLFRETVGKRIEGKIPVEYAFQEINDVPENVNIPEGRVKPWGTGHAVLCARNKVTSDFVMINSDDFYGYDAYKKIKEFFDNNNDSNCYSMVAFKVENTMTENGSVKRGVCESNDNYLTNIIESSIERQGDKIIASPLDGRDSFEVKGDAPVSMNFFGFTNQMFETLEIGFKKFFDLNKDNLEKCEYLIPDVVFEEIKNNGKHVRVLESTDKWLGVTYKEDKEFVVSEIKKLIEKGVYPNDLWK
jgi:bifunctional N-acetylglucosamine-1-phosphate-uridyltransferase/glucosamine-1-phosphate-acetyltransferase GlmU-like protein